MKNFFTVTLTLLLGSSLLFSCEKCDDPIVTAPTLEDTQWLVYSRKDSAIFVNEEGARIKYTVTDSVTQTVIGKGVSLDDNCYNKLDSQSLVILKDKNKTLPDIATFIYKMPAKLEVRLAVQDSEAKEVSINSPTYSTKQINGIAYKDVYELNLQKQKVYSAKQILFNKRYGFLRIEFYDGTFIERKQ
jgi:hypothetical protein